VLVAARARARRHEQAVVANLVEDVLVGTTRRRLPEQVVATLESLDAARRAPRLPALV
jgi:hypothetical protein